MKFYKENQLKCLLPPCTVTMSNVVSWQHDSCWQRLYDDESLRSKNCSDEWQRTSGGAEGVENHSVTQNINVSDCWIRLQTSSLCVWSTVQCCFLMFNELIKQSVTSQVAKDSTALVLLISKLQTGVFIVLGSQGWEQSSLYPYTSLTNSLLHKTLVQMCPSISLALSSKTSSSRSSS